MSARNYQQTLSAGQQIDLPGGRYFFIRTAASALNIATKGNPGAPVTFDGVGAGTKFGPVLPDQAWKQLSVTSPAAQAIEIIISDDGLFDVANTVTVSGSVTTQTTPASSVADTAPVTLATASAAVLFAANVTRRRVRVFVDSNNAGSCFGRTGAATNNIVELQPGVEYQFDGIYGLQVRNDTGSNATFYIFEES